MKKLLALLGATSLVTSASIAVVACGPTEPTEPGTDPDNEMEFQELLNEYKSQIMQKFINNYNTNMNNFSLLNTDSKLENYEFLNLEKLAEIGTNEAYELNETEVTSFLNDINSILNVDNLISDINGLANEPEFNLLTSGLNNNIFESLEIKNNQISLEVKDNGLQQGLSVNLRFELVLNFNYVKNGEVQSESLSAKRLSFSIIDNSDVDGVIQSIISNLGSELYKGEDSPLYFTDKKMGMEDQAFKEDISSETNNYVSDTTFKGLLSQAIADIASASGVASIAVNINELNASEIAWNNQYAKFTSKNAKTVNTDSDFFKILVNPNEEDYSYEQRIEIIENNYSSQLDDTKFKDSLNKFLAQNDLTPETKVNYDSILGFGTFDISNIVLEVGDNSYAVPTLNLLFDYSVEDFKRADYSSQILNSLTAFQKVYGIEASENSIFTIKSEYFWNMIDERHPIGSADWSKSTMNELTTNYSQYQINEMSFEIGKEAKFGDDGFNLYANTSTRFKNTENGIVLSNRNWASSDQLRMKLGVFFIDIRYVGDKLSSVNNGERLYFTR